MSGLDGISVSRTSDKHDMEEQGREEETLDWAHHNFWLTQSLRGQANEASICFTVRAGAVTFQGPPRLSNETIITIKYDGGFPDFQPRCGDYYVAGYKPGGDTGLMMSGSNAAKTDLEKFSITIKVKGLIVKVSKIHANEFETSETKSPLKLVDTILSTISAENFLTQAVLLRSRKYGSKQAR